MKKYLCILFTLYPMWLFAQSDFDNQVSKSVLSIVKKLEATNEHKKKIVVIQFQEIDGSQTYLGKFLSEEVSSELANQSENQKLFDIVGQDRIRSIIKEKNISSSEPSLLAKTVGSIGLADIIIFGVITDFDTDFRVNVKLYSTQTSNEIGSVKLSFSKTPSLSSFHTRRVILSEKDFQNVSTLTNNSVVPAVKEVPLQEKNCLTGDFCFENASKKRKVIEILGAENIVGGHTILYKITVLPGEKGCLYGIPAVVHNVAITTYDVDGGYDANGSYTIPVFHVENRQIRVAKCAAESNLTPLKLN
jgi:hypothetical protein